MNPAVERLHHLYRLKEVPRHGTVGERYESAAEHTYSALVLAQWFLGGISLPLDEAKVMRILLMHDWVEAHAGDTFILDESARADQHSRENIAAKRLEEELPANLAQPFRDAWKEFTEQATREARFAKAIDQLDPVVHSLFRKTDWTKHHWREQPYRQKKAALLAEFPPLLEMFDEIMDHMRSEGYFSDTNE